jgi:hypothetical protein
MKNVVPTRSMRANGFLPQLTHSGIKTVIIRFVDVRCYSFAEASEVIEV